MDDQLVEEIKAQLDADLAKAGGDVGIAFGLGLFAAFKERNWFTLEKWSILGTTLFAEDLPTYNNSHPAIVTWDIDDSAYRVSRTAHRT